MTKAALLHFLTEFAPLIVFFISAQLYPFNTAAGHLLAATVLSLCLSLWHENRIPTLPLLSAAVVIVSASITIKFDKPDAIILADTVYFFSLALAIAIGFLRSHYVLKILFAPTFGITDEGWRLLSIQWLAVLTLAGIGNELIRILTTPEVWIDYRFVKIAILFLIAGSQFRIARRYRIPEVTNAWGIRTVPFKR